VAGASGLGVVLEVVRVARHHDGDVVLLQQIVDSRKRLAVRGQIGATRVEGVAEHHHDELAPRLVEGSLEPLQLHRIHVPDNPGVHRDQREVVGLDIEEGRALEACRHAVLPAV
jgi:hypothetical protein